MEWYERKFWAGRLAQESAVMGQRFPQFVLRREESGQLWWEGAVEPIAGVLYRVAIRYPENYPYAEPSLWLLEPPLEPNTPHVYASGAICIHKQVWNASTGTAASLVPVISAWLLVYTTWRATGGEF